MVCRTYKDWGQARFGRQHYCYLGLKPSMPFSRLDVAWHFQDSTSLVAFASYCIDFEYVLLVAFNSTIE